MRPIADEELQRRIDTFEAILQDRCIILRWNGTTHVADSTETACRFRTAAQVLGVGELITLASATSPGMTVTLPPDADLDANDRIRMTARKGRAISPTVDYIQESAPAVDQMATITKLRKAMP